MKLSIVTTLYNSSSTVDEFYRRAVNAAEAVTQDFEIVLVDDGSPDDSLDIACHLAKEDCRVRVVELSRNFGHHKALMTGLDHAAGDLCFLIDSDLEEDPELLLTFLKELEAHDVDVVYGYQSKRKGGLVERVTGDLAYKLFNSLLTHPVPLNAVTVRLMKREYVNSLLMHRERQTVIGGLWVLTGYRQLGVPVNKVARPTSTYGFWRRWHALVDSISAFSETPLVAIFYLGLVISGLSALMGTWLFVRWFFFGNTLAGWVSVMLSVWFLGGVLIFCVGIIGIYISKIFIETKNRPYTIVRRVHPYSGADQDLRATQDTPDHTPTRSMRQRRGAHDGQQAFADAPMTLKRVRDGSDRD
jgi:putative glycosyltransferase